MSALIKSKPYAVVPTTLEEAWRYAQIIGSSNLCPASFKDKFGKANIADIFIAMQMGAGVGFDPMQAVQNIAVIKGRPAIYGDAIPALVLSHPACGGIREWYEGEEGTDDYKACCGMTRNGKEEVRYFSIGDAKKAGLWGKDGPWKQYDKRMLQMRARGFCARDQFADALKGLKSKEEIEDYTDYSRPTGESNGFKGNVIQADPIGVEAEKIIHAVDAPNPEVDLLIEAIKECTSEEQVLEVCPPSKIIGLHEDLVSRVRAAYQFKINEIKKTAEAAKEFFNE